MSISAYDDTPSTSSTDVLSAGAIAGIAIACFLIIIAIAVFFGFRWYRKREREKQEAWEAENRKVGSYLRIRIIKIYPI